MSDDSATLPAFQVHYESGSVTVSKYRTKRGERADIATEEHRIRLDALILESLSWQRSRDTIATQIEDGELIRSDETPLCGGETVTASPSFRITNEYAQVELSHARTPNGEVLKLTTPARGSELNLGVPSLRALATQSDTFAFSAFFETPVGPEDTPVEGPH